MAAHCTQCNQPASEDDKHGGGKGTQVRAGQATHVSNSTQGSAEPSRTVLSSSGVASGAALRSLGAGKGDGGQGSQDQRRRRLGVQTRDGQS